MPNISVKTNAQISKDKETLLKSKIGQAIAILPGKSESWLMCSFEDNCRIWFQGSDEPAAFIEVQVYGRVNPAAADKLTAELCSMIETELGIPQSRIYVKYEDVAIWGWSGNNF